MEGIYSEHSACNVTYLCLRVWLKIRIFTTQKTDEGDCVLVSLTRCLILTVLERLFEV